MGEEQKSLSAINMLEELWMKVRRNTFFKLGVTFGVSYLLYLLAPFLLPILLSIALAFLLYPLTKVLSQMTLAQGTMHLSRVIAIILAILCFGLLVFLIISIFILPLLGQINSLFRRFPELQAGMQSADLSGILTKGGKLPELPSNLEGFAEFVINWAMGTVGNILRNLFESSLEIVKSLVGLIIVPFLTFYFLKDWRELRNMAVEFFDKEDQPKAADIFDEIGETLSAYTGGLGKLSLLSGAVVTCGTAALGVDYPLVLGFWALLAEMVPVVGPLMGAIPAVFLAYGSSTQTAIYVALLYTIYYQLDANVIMPKIMGDKLKLKPVVIIIALLIGARLFGILGMIFSVPVAAVYRVLYDHLWHVE